MYPRPRKRFGQHFLHDRGVIERILNAFNPRPGETVVEIGPGRGALTLPLLDRLHRLHAVELDRDLAGTLPGFAAVHGELLIHQADALRFDFTALAPATGGLRIVGNLPYNISTPLLFHLLEQADAITDMVFMLQKEVADRMVAPPGGKDYGRLSVMLQFRFSMEHLFDVGPGAFSPPPQVESSVVRLRPKPVTALPDVDKPRFGRVVQSAFAQRRKTLRNALRGIVDDAGFAQTGIAPDRRAETLSLEEFVRLTRVATTTDTSR